MTGGDWALLIGLALNAGAIIFAAIMLSKRVEMVHQEMNGMKEALIAAARLEGFHTGEAKGRADSEREHAVKR